MIIRTFHPVGQGAFYTEEFIDDYFTMIYDCGSYTGKATIEGEIKKSGLKKEIDLLVISHFHDDHINGLEYLLKNHTIKNILLPFLHNEDKIEVYLHNSEANVFIKNLCLHPEETINQISEGTKVIFVTEYDSENSNDAESISLSKIEDKIDSGKTIKVGSKWVYIPFNFRYKTRSSQLKKKFMYKKIPLNIDDFLVFYKTNKKVVIDAYKSITGDMNTNSLVLYSGIKKQPMFSIEYPILDCFPFCYGYQENVACLYMGDYNAKGPLKINELEKAFAKCCEYIGTIQIPHHGSRYNYNPRLNFKKNLISVISAGIDNIYKHPHCSTLKQIILHRGIPIIVTEKSSTKFIQKIIYQEDNLLIPINTAET